MPDLTICVVDVYPYRTGERESAAEFLLLRRVPEVVYAGQ